MQMYKKYAKICKFSQQDMKGFKKDYKIWSKIWHYIWCLGFYKVCYKLYATFVQNMARKVCKKCTKVVV